jgi:LytS/YehU family sensor histidine kinase
MRYMLYESTDAQVTLAKEVEYLNNFIELQRIRFGEDVEINLTISGSLNNQLIEPMLLIPFVENAFKHGVGVIDKPVIDIQLQIDRNHLIFKTRNKIDDQASGEKDVDSGIGLKNVRRRLELLYPDVHQLQINSNDNWFEVQMNLSLFENPGSEQIEVK